jgi:S1-C subfamily serine protease
MALIGTVVTFMPLWAQERQQPPRASLGVMVEQNPANADQAGVRIGMVEPNGPAAKAGIEPGDIITKVGDRQVKDYGAVVDALDQHKPGDQVAVMVMRNGQEKKFTITLGERTALLPGAQGPIREGRGTAFLGVQTQDLTSDLKNQLGVATEHGALVTDVAPDTPAAKAGLRQEDVITGVDGKKIANAEELREVIRQAGPGKKVTIQVDRGKEHKELTAQLDRAPATTSRFPRLGPLPSEGIPGSGLPGGFFPERQRIDQLERQVRQLEERVRDLERKQGSPPPATSKK